MGMKRALSLEFDHPFDSYAVWLQGVALKHCSKGLILNPANQERAKSVHF